MYRLIVKRSDSHDQEKTFGGGIYLFFLVKRKNKWWSLFHREAECVDRVKGLSSWWPCCRWPWPFQAFLCAAV